MKTETLNIRIDAETKEQAEKIFSALGIPTSTAITMFLKSAIRCQGFPCDLSVDPFYSAENQARLQKSIADYEAKKSSPIVKTLSELEAMENA